MLLYLWKRPSPGSLYHGNVADFRPGILEKKYRLRQPDLGEIMGAQLAAIGWTFNQLLQVPP